MSDNGVTKQDLVEMETRIVGAILGEMGIRFGETAIRFGEVTKRLDRVEATLKLQVRNIAAGNQWVVKADEDYARVLAELADLKVRMMKLEGGQSGNSY